MQSAKKKVTLHTAFGLSDLQCGLWIQCNCLSQWRIREKRWGHLYPPLPTPILHIIQICRICRSIRMHKLHQSPILTACPILDKGPTWTETLDTSGIWLLILWNSSLYNQYKYRFFFCVAFSFWFSPPASYFFLTPELYHTKWAFMFLYFFPKAINWELQETILAPLFISEKFNSSPQFSFRNSAMCKNLKP